MIAKATGALSSPMRRQAAQPRSPQADNLVYKRLLHQREHTGLLDITISGNPVFSKPEGIPVDPDHSEYNNRYYKPLQISHNSGVPDYADRSKSQQHPASFINSYHPKCIGPLRLAYMNPKQYNLVPALLLLLHWQLSWPVLASQCLPIKQKERVLYQHQVFRIRLSGIHELRRRPNRTIMNLTEDEMDELQHEIDTSPTYSASKSSPRSPKVH